MRKKTWICLSTLLVAMTGSALGAEFQPIGALGIGGAGVARTTNAYAGYWNPAGLAFNETTMSIPLAVGVGLRVSQGLADNVDRLSKFTEEDPTTGKSLFDNIKNLDVSGANPKVVGDMISFLAIIDDIKTQKGTLSMNANAVVAMQIKHFGFGAFGSLEGFAQPQPDLVRVLPTQGVGSTTTVTPTSLFDAANATSTPVTATPQFFTASQIQQISAIFSNTSTPGAISATQATQLALTIDAQLAANPNPTGLSNDAILNTITTSFNQQLQTGGTANASNSIDNNKTGVLVKSLAYTEIPLSYGHPIDMGKYGQLGVGGSVKAVYGRVYESRIVLIEKDPVTGESRAVDSSDITSNFTKNYEESTSVTVDLGLFYKYGSWLNVGLVAKNLTTPSFEAPPLKNQKGELVDQNGDLTTTPFKGEKVKLKPQVRMGVALEPFSWMSLAADLDLTENESVLSTLDFKSRQLGGGLELHPFTWFKLRGGAYTNLANSEIGPVATAGLTFGTKWVNLEVDGGYGLKTAKYKDKSYPREAKAQLALNIQF